MTASKTPTVSDAMREAVAPELDRFDTAYKAACETSDPQRWMEAALFGQQLRNALLAPAGPIASALAALERENATLRAERDEARADAFLLAANQCEGPMFGDEHGHSYCAKLRAAEAELATLRTSAERMEAEHAEETARLTAVETPRPISEWHEDMGFALWWILPVCEPPYSGSPGCDDWPEYHTHFTPLPVIRDAAWRDAALTPKETPDA